MFRIVLFIFVVCLVVTPPASATTTIVKDVEKEPVITVVQLEAPVENLISVELNDGTPVDATLMSDGQTVVIDSEDLPDEVSEDVNFEVSER